MKTAVDLYHKYAKNMPIYDYHCHLSPKEIAENRKFNNITELWLAGDHYKWRGMRAHGIDESTLQVMPAIKKSSRHGQKQFLIRLEIRSIIGHI